MRQFRALLVCFVVLVAACSSDDAADDSPLGPAVLPALVSALTDSGDATPEAWTAHGGLIGFVAPRFESTTQDPTDAAWEYFATFADAYGISDPRARLEVVRVVSSTTGTIVRLRQTIGGVAMFASDVTVAVSASGRVDRVMGIVVPDAELAGPVLTADDAVGEALARIEGSIWSEQAPRLFALSPAIESMSNADPSPVWEVVLLADADSDGVFLEELVLIDAITGEISLRAGLELEAEAWNVYDAHNELTEDGKKTLAKAELIFETRGGRVTEHSQADGDARAAFANIATTWAYFFDVHGRDSYDDAGGQCDVYVHVGVGWEGAGSRGCALKFGDGLALAEALDVMAHEFTHAVTGATAGLVYEGQSGAVDEHYSDFFAAMIETSDWILTPSSRDMSAPSISSVDAFITTERDHGGVHSNSGIGNMVGYLVASEGVHAHVDSAVEVRGIGRAKAEQIWYATLLSLSPRTDYGSWACATIFTARDMADGVLTDEDVLSVENAMIAVGLAQRDPLQGLSCDPLGPGFEVSGSTGDGSTPGTTGASSTTEPTSASTTTITDAACDVVGMWRLQDQPFFDEIASMSGGAAGDFEYISGNYFVELKADGTAVASRVEWTWRLAAPDGNIVFEISSTDPGTWSVDEMTMAFQEVASEAVVKMWIETGGSLTPVPISPGGTAVQTPSATGTGTFTCVGDVLTVTADGDTGPITAVFDRLAD